MKNIPDNYEPLLNDAILEMGTIIDRVMPFVEELGEKLVFNVGDNIVIVKKATTISDNASPEDKTVIDKIAEYIRIKETLLEPQKNEAKSPESWNWWLGRGEELDDLKKFLGIKEEPDSDKIIL